MNDDTFRAPTAQVDGAVGASVADSLGRIARILHARSLPTDESVVLLDFDEDGVIVATVDLAARALRALTTDSTAPGQLDRVIADHLIRIGRVAPSMAPAWDHELLELVARGRQRLRAADGTFIMGREHIRLFRLTRRDVEESTRDLIARVETITWAAVVDASTPAVAVVVADGVRNWPGLRDAVAKAVPVPVLDLLEAAPASATTADLDAAQALAASKSARPEIDDAASVDFPAMAPDVNPKGIEPAVIDAPVRPLAPSASVISSPGVVDADERPTDEIPVIAPALAYSDLPPELVEPQPVEPQPDEYVAAVAQPASPARRWGLLTRSGGKRVAAVIGAVVILAFLGVATVFAQSDDDSTPKNPAAESAAPAPQSADPSYADPAILAEARLPAASYHPPRPSPRPRPTTTPHDSTPHPRSRPRHRPRPRLTIPIPGLPPIVVP